MPPRPPLPIALHPSQPPYRLFHLSARLRLRDRPSPTPSQEAANDYYSLLLSTPTTAAKKTISPARAPKSTQPSPSTSLPPPSTAIKSAPIETSAAGPNNQVLFSRVLDGPSARMRGLARAEGGMGRPPEPDNCCMSGCVNCVWDAYREEVEEWAAARRRQGAQNAQFAGRSGKRRTGGIGTEGRVIGMEDEGGGVGDLDGPVGLSGYEGVDLSDEEMFRGVPVGIMEFMNTEKRLRERRAAEKAG